MSDLGSAHGFAGRLTAATLLVLACLGLLATPGQAQTRGRTVLTTTVDGPITPVVADHLRDVVAAAVADGHEAVVITLDTPGGLVDAMRDIVQTELAAPLPVLVLVGPAGADAASAGTFVTLAAHVAAMAPATTIGAATPVDLQGGETSSDKVVNNLAAVARSIATERGRDVTFAVEAVTEGRAVTAEEAVALGVVDLVAADVADLLTAVDGRTVTLGDGRTVTLDTAGATLVEREMSLPRRVLQTLADPNLAFVLLSLGTLAILYEIASPGLGAGGVIGTISLVLAFVSLAVLPVSQAGLLLLVVAGGLFVAELLAPGIGVAAAGGTASLVLGGLLLFDEPTGLQVSVAVLVPVAVVALGLVVAAGMLVRRTRPAGSTGEDHVIGQQLVLRERRDGTVGVRFDGAWWNIDLVTDTAPDTLDLRGREPGRVVQVVATSGNRLVVVPLDAAATAVVPVTATDDRAGHPSHDHLDHDHPDATDDPTHPAAP